MREPGCVATCFGCSHRDLSLSESLQKKREWIERELGQSVLPVKTAPLRWRYRVKVTLRAQWNQEWKFGLVKYRGREEIFIPIPQCPIHSTEANSILSWIRNLDRDLPLFAVIVSPQTVVCVLKEKRNKRSLESMQSYPMPSHLDVFVNWNPVAGKRTIQYGQTEKVSGSLIRGNTKSSLQNTYSTSSEAMYFRQQISSLHKEALEEAQHFFFQEEIPKKLVDWYCGSGSSLKLWPQTIESLGVELFGDSVELAKTNAPWAQVLKGRVEDRLPQVDEFLAGDSFFLYTNPSRSGHSTKELEWIEQRKPSKVAYLSCHPRSLAGDLKKLSSYRIVKIQPYDFFPQTDQVETLTLLQKI